MGPNTPFEKAISATTALNTPAAADTIVVDGQALVNFEVDNAAAAAVNSFIVQLQDHINGEWYNYLGGADFATNSANMLFSSSTGPQATAGGGKAHASIRVNGAYAMRFKCSLAAGAGVVTVRGSMARI